MCRKDERHVQRCQLEVAGVVEFVRDVHITPNEPVVNPSIDSVVHATAFEVGLCPAVCLHQESPSEFQVTCDGIRQRVYPCEAAKERIIVPHDAASEFSCCEEAPHESLGLHAWFVFVAGPADDCPINGEVKRHPP